MKLSDIELKFSELEIFILKALQVIEELVKTVWFKIKSIPNYTISNKSLNSQLIKFISLQMK